MRTTGIPLIITGVLAAAAAWLLTLGWHVTGASLAVVALLAIIRTFTLRHGDRATHAHAGFMLVGLCRASRLRDPAAEWQMPR